MYEVFEHTADLGIHVEADSLNSLFDEAGRALFSVIVANLDEVRPVQTMSFAIAGQDKELLLLDWLCELLYKFESERVLLNEFTVTIDRDGLTATARGEVVDLDRHQLEHEVKAITYHGLKIEQRDSVWKADVIVDI